MQGGVKKDNAIPWGVQLGGPSTNVASYSAEHLRYDEQSNSEKAFNEVERRPTFVTCHQLRLVGKVVQFQHRGDCSNTVLAIAGPCTHERQHPTRALANQNAASHLRQSERLSVRQA